MPKPSIMKRYKVAAFIALLFSAAANAQVKGDSATAAGSHFNDSRSRHKWMGANYRKEWNTPITVPVLNMAIEKGGLTPVKKGGGKQTKSLRVEDAQGRQYTFRSIQKFITSKTLPGDLQSEAAADLVSDGVSASYPYAALSIPVLAEAAGIPHGNPRVVYIGDDPKLGEFREDFKNTMVLYEERAPDSVSKLFDTDEVAEKLEKDNDNDVDQLALLKVRILDMFVMDLDRHEDQWVWGAYDNGKGKTYYPLAKDRDQAFYINQGILPGIVKSKSLVPQLEGFKADANSIARFNFAARNLDRFFLNQLSEADWKREAEAFLAKMTDAVIEKALAQQPKEIYSISAPKIIQTLKNRRNFIVNDVMEYYKFISEVVSITGSDKKEQYHITRNETGAVTVSVNKITKEGEVSTKMYERVFEPLVTKEIRIYGFDGDDQFEVFGVNDKIKIRLIGGGGTDAFVKKAGQQRDVMIYDKADAENTVSGRFKNNFSNDTAVNSFQRIYYKYPHQSKFLNLGFNPDDGFSIGPTFKYTRHGFRKEPFKTFHQFKGLFAFATKAVNIMYRNELISVFGKNTDIVTNLNYYGPNNTSNFFGYGMGSVYDKTKPGRFRFYRARYDLGDFTVQLRHRFSSKVMLSFGPQFQTYHMEATDKLNSVRNITLNTASSGLNPALVFKRQGYFGGKLSLEIDTRNSQAMPYKGINWVTNFSSLSGTNNNSYDRVSILSSDFSFYLKLIPEWLTFANRTGVGVTGGNSYEFFQAQYLGSNENLRGYRRERFAGRSKFYNQAELRLKVANLRTYLFPAAIGVFGFVDAGRVWHPSSALDKTAVGYGGGIWFSPLRRFVITASYAMSDEDRLLLIGFGWKF
jgi:hypothetical protein